MPGAEIEELLLAEASGELFETGTSVFDRIAKGKRSEIVLLCRREVKLFRVGVYGGSRTTPQRRDIAEVGHGRRQGIGDSDSGNPSRP